MRLLLYLACQSLHSRTTCSSTVQGGIISPCSQSLESPDGVLAVLGLPSACYQLWKPLLGGAAGGKSACSKMCHLASAPSPQNQDIPQAVPALWMHLWRSWLLQQKIELTPATVL